MIVIHGVSSGLTRESFGILIHINSYRMQNGITMIKYQRWEE